MTFVEAAIEILRQNNNIPLSPSEIWSKICQQKLVQTNGKTPIASLDTRLRTYQQDSKLSNLLKYNPKGRVFFIGVGTPVRFKLIDSLFDKSITESSKIDTITSDAPSSGIGILDKGPAYQIVDETLGWKKLSIYRSDTGVAYCLEACDLFTYFLNDPSGKIVKIGKTKGDPSSRLSSLRTSNRGATYNHIFPSSLYTETQLHDMFQDIHDDGEWFFRAAKLENFLSVEKNRHEKVLASYKKSLEYKSIEQDMLAML